MHRSSGREWSRREFGKLLGTSALGSIFGLWPGALSHASTFPSEPISLLIGYAPGGVTDFAGRLLAEHLSASFGRVVVVNRAGATGSIAAQYVAQAQPDGYTLLLGNNPEISINQFLTGDGSFNPETDLKPIAPVYSTTHVVVVPSDSPYASLEELLDAARAAPGTIRFGSTGNGTPSHLAGEALALMSNVEMIHIPYQGGGPALVDVMGGHIECCVSSFPSAKPHADSDSLKMLAVTSHERVSGAPDLPTVREVLGIESFDFPLFAGIFAPAGIPEDIAVLINQEVANVLKDADLRAKFDDQNLVIDQFSTDEYASYIREQILLSQSILNDIGLTPQN